VLLGLSLVSFTIISLVPGDPARALAGPQTPPNVLVQIRHGWGLDRPLPLRYLSYLGHVARGDLGRSYIQDESVLSAIFSRLPQTVELALAGILCELLVAFPLGIVAAARSGGLLDRA